MRPHIWTAVSKVAAADWLWELLHPFYLILKEQVTFTFLWPDHSALCSSQLEMRQYQPHPFSAWYTAHFTIFSLPTKVSNRMSQCINYFVLCFWLPKRTSKSPKNVLRIPTTALNSTTLVRWWSLPHRMLSGQLRAFIRYRTIGFYLWELNDC